MALPGVSFQGEFGARAGRAVRAAGRRPPPFYFAARV